jgi:hypothetical protein
MKPKREFDLQEIGENGLSVGRCVSLHSHLNESNERIDKRNERNERKETEREVEILKYTKIA